jgi:hypothetical protein
MKKLAALLIWGSVLAVLAIAVWAGLRPDGGALYSNPLACLGVGLIGLGMCMEGRRRLLAHAPVPVRRQIED